MLKEMVTAAGSYVRDYRSTRLVRRMGLKASQRGSRPEHLDLQLHSFYSDGLFSPPQLVQAAKFLGLRAVALSDHNTCAGIALMQSACAEMGVGFIPAVELNTDRGRMHILGYHMSFSNPELLRRMNEIQEIVMENVATSLRNLNQNGLKLTEAEITKTFPLGAFSLTHLAEALRLKGLVGSIPQGLRLIRSLYEKFEPEKKPPYFTIEEAVRLIHEDGGLPIWGHPESVWDREKIFKELLAEGVWGKNGLMGFEFVHGRTPESAALSLLAMIDTLRSMGINPILTAGSDFHDGRREKFGLVDMTYEIGKAEVLLGRLDAARKDKASILIQS